MPEYKLHYFNIRGLGEPIRQIFAHAEVPYEDVRIEREEWNDEKKKELEVEWGQLPMLSIDGKKKTQSYAIVRHLAKKYNLAGANECEEFRCDEVTEAIRDYTNKWMPMFAAFFAGDMVKAEAAKKTIVEVDTPLYFGRFNSLLEKKGNTWLVGNQLTYADIVLVHVATSFSTAFDLNLSKGFPAIEKLIAAVHSEPKIKAWLDKRPVTKF